MRYAFIQRVRSTGVMGGSWRLWAISGAKMWWNERGCWLAVWMAGWHVVGGLPDMAGVSLDGMMEQRWVA